MSNQQDIQTAIQLFQSGNISQSKIILEKYIVALPNDVNVNLLSAAISAAESDFSGVVEKCKKVLEIEPGNTHAIYNAAVASDKLNNYQDLLEFSLQYMQLDPANVAAGIFQVKALNHLGSTRESMEKACQIILDNNENADLVERVVAIFSKNEDTSLSEQLLEQVLVKIPTSIVILYNLVNLKFIKRDYTKAELYLSKLVSIDQNDILTIKAQINILYAQGRIRECIRLLESLSQESFSALPELSIKLAECYMSISDNDKAILLLNNNIVANINPAQCFHNIGIAEDRRGNIDEAIQAYQSAVNLEPTSLSSYYNLAFLWNKQGDKLQALKAIRRCLKMQDSPRVRRAYVELLSTASVDQMVSSDEKFIVDVMKDDITNAQALSSLVMGLLIHRSSVLNELYLRSVDRDYGGFSETFKKHIDEIANNDLLCLFYINLPVTNYDFEIFSKMLRRVLLLECRDNPVNLNKTKNICASIAIRCYIDSYVFTTDEHETETVDELISNILINDNLSDQNYLSVLAMYVSLYELSRKHGVSIDVIGDDDIISRLVKLQLHDNLIEEDIRDTIESPAEIYDEISLTVQSQYECNPYPVWQILSIREPEPLNDIISRTTSSSKCDEPVITHPDILIAGCGTGSHVLQTAMRIDHRSLTAIDLSKRSLSFAVRKAREYGFDNIDFKQLDILHVSALDRKFDYIESVGVLHHMNNPLEGFKCLADILKPGGLMYIGLYSKLGRRYILKAKSIYDDAKRYISDDEIRDYRIDIMNSNDKKMVNNLSDSKEFYSLNECRDLIFHENENNYDINELSELVDNAGMEFIGFDLYDASVMSDFHKMFPSDDTQSDLKNWAIFEEIYPDTFASMYVFWCRKR